MWVCKQIRANIQGVHKNDTGAHFDRIPYKKWYISIFRRIEKFEAKCFQKTHQTKIFVAKHFQNLPDFQILVINSSIWQPCWDQAEDVWLITVISQRFRTLDSDYTTCYLAPYGTTYVTTHGHELVECFFLLLRSAKCATAKFIVIAELIETICFVDFAIFHVYLIQIYFESKCSKKILFLDSTDVLWEGPSNDKCWKEVQK